MRGVHAKTLIRENEIINSIPLKCLITCEMGKATEVRVGPYSLTQSFCGIQVGKKILHAQLKMDAPKHIYLMVFMLEDRLQADSFFKPYYDILPATLNCMPIFWTKEELKWLDGYYILKQTEDRRVRTHPLTCHK